MENRSGRSFNLLAKSGGSDKIVVFGSQQRGLSVWFKVGWYEKFLFPRAPTVHGPPTDTVPLMMVETWTYMVGSNDPPGPSFPRTSL